MSIAELSTEQIYKTIRESFGKMNERPDGVSMIAELSKESGVHPRTLRIEVGKLIDSGRCEFAGRVEGKTMDGRRATIPAYRLIEPDAESESELE